MSRQLGMDCIACRPTPRPAHVEYSLEYHASLIRKVTGFTDGTGGIPQPTDVMRGFYDAWDYDFLFGTHDGFVDWSKAGRCTNMGHAFYAGDGSDQQAPGVCPFQEPEEVWAFNPVTEYGLTPYDRLVAGYEQDYLSRKATFPNIHTSLNRPP